MKKDVAVVMGGYSSEYAISIQSGKVVADNLNPNFYNVYQVQIKQDSWLVLAKDSQNVPVNKKDFSFENREGEIIQPDVVFNAIHGTPGEDGLLQAYLNMLGIPHTSCGHYQAALTFNKRDCIAVLKHSGITSATSYFIDKGDDLPTEDIIEKTGLPCFVKPNRSGSSFGISKVDEQSELLPAIKKAFVEDDQVLVEEMIDGVEVSVGVVKTGDHIIVLPPTEIVSENAFFDYAAKYEGKSEEITPARISKEEAQAVTAATEKIYTTLHMNGLARADFIIDQSGQPHFIEMNSNPGLTEESIVPKQVKAANMSLQKLCGDVVQAALENHGE